MNNATLGISAVLLAGILNGSFPAPSKGVREWKWEHLWLIYSLCAMAILPVALASVFGLRAVIQILGANPLIALKIAAFGALWGLGSVLFGVSLVRLGMAITNALISGLVVFFGSIGPVLFGVIHIDRERLLWLVGGLSLLVVSLTLCAAASIARDAGRSEEPSAPVSSRARGRAISGVLIAVIAGLLSSMLNFGFVVGYRLTEAAAAKGFPAAAASVVVWIPVLLGGIVFNMGYPAYLISRSRSWDVYVNAPRRFICFLRAFLMGLLWFGGVQFYGFGASAMGSDGAVYGWALIVAVSILTSNTWGAATGEWRGTGARSKTLMWLATAMLICSFALLVVQQTRG